MHFKKLMILSLLSCTLFCTAVPVYASGGMESAITSVNSSIADFSYDSELSLLKITPRSSDGVTYFCYKIGSSADGVSYPTYSMDKVYFFNPDGTVSDTKTGMQNQPIFTDDYSTWIDVSKTHPSVAPESDYYTYFRQGDGEVVLPYSESGDGTFYLPLEDNPTYITVYAINVDSTGNVSEVSSANFVFSGVSTPLPSEITASITLVSKSDEAETVRITGNYADGMDYVQLGRDIYKFDGNSVDIELKSNGDKSFRVYGKNNPMPIVLTYTVAGLKADTELNKDVPVLDDKLDNTAPIISVGAIPVEIQTKAVKFSIYTDEESTISCNGVSTIGTELTVNIVGNGDYLITATDKSGNYSEKVVTFSCFENGVAENGEYVLDRDNFWEGTSDLLKLLPQSGSISLFGVLSLCGVLGAIGTIVGIVLIRLDKKGRSKDEDVV